jgi:hypothetical protein
MTDRIAGAAVFALAAALSGPAPAQADDALAAKLQTIADAYIADTASGERATAISISVSLPEGGGTVNVTAGEVSNQAGVSRPEEVNNWVRALFTSEDLLDADARAELTRVVSMRTGETLARLTANDPHGFGLGISGFASPAIGSGWQYEGESMGFRTLYIYLPEQDLVVTLALNSGAEGEADHAGKLGLAVIEAAQGQ